MKRRSLLKMAAIPAIPFALSSGLAATAWGASASNKSARSRVRPGDAGWPSAASWDKLGKKVEGQLVKLDSFFAGCAAAANSPACTEALAHLANTFDIGDQAALTQTSGWIDAWTSQPSVFALAIIAGGAGPQYPGMPGAVPDPAQG